MRFDWCFDNRGFHEGQYIENDRFISSGREIEMLQYLMDNELDITHSPLLGTFVYETLYTLAANDEIRDSLLENGYELTNVDLEHGSVDICCLKCFNLFVRSVNLVIMHSGMIIKTKKQEIS